MDDDTEDLEKTRLRFPSQFHNMADVFGFSYHAMVDAAGRFDPEVDIEELLEELQEFLAKEADNDGSAATVLDLVHAEQEIITFSKTSRCSIIQL